MDNRLLLHEELKLILGNNNAYFQPPSSHRLDYPCVIYNIGNGEAKHANNKLYKYDHKYELLFIYKGPTTAIIEKVLSTLPMSKLSRVYISDNLHHYAFSIYY